MAVFKLNFNLNTWIDNFTIEAASKEEAIEKLYTMDVKDIIEEGYIKESDVSDTDSIMVECTVDVEVSGIKWDISEDDADMVDMSVEELKATLPTIVTLTGISVSTSDERYPVSDLDIEEAIADELTYQYDFSHNGFIYKIIKQY